MSNILRGDMAEMHKKRHSSELSFWSKPRHEAVFYTKPDDEMTVSFNQV